MIHCKLQNKQNKAVDAEHKAWQTVCEKLKIMLSMDSAQFNASADVKELVTLIEKYGYAEYSRRTALGHTTPDGVFFDDTKVVNK